MKAIVYHRYGSPDVLELREVDRPAIKPGEVLIRVHAAAVGPEVWHYVTGMPYPMRLISGLFKPKHKIPGLDVAGRVEEVGRDVTSLRPGDEVFGELGAGSLAEFACAAEDAVVAKPTNLTLEQAAAVPVSGITALQALRDKARVQPGHRVLINGASGGVGTFAVQIARSLGAEVTGVCSTRNVELVLSLGAHQVIDYTREDFTRSPEPYDMIFDMVGSRPLSACRRILSPNGVYVSSVGRLSWIFQVMLASMGGRQKLVLFSAEPSREDLESLKALIEAGEVTPVIDRQYPLRDVPDAVRYQSTGRARGKIVITVG